MQIAPPSWRAEWNGTPASRSALVAVRLPLPRRPKTASTPSAASALPTASATCTALPDGPPEEHRADHGEDRREDRNRPAERREDREQGRDDKHEPQRPAREREVVRALLALAA